MNDIEKLINLLVKIEELAFSKLIKIELPSLIDTKKFTDVYLMDLQNSMCDFHVSLVRGQN